MTNSWKQYKYFDYSVIIKNQIKLPYIPSLLFFIDSLYAKMASYKVSYRKLACLFSSGSVIIHPPVDKIDTSKRMIPLSNA